MKSKIAIQIRTVMRCMDPALINPIDIYRDSVEAHGKKQLLLLPFIQPVPWGWFKSHNLGYTQLPQIYLSFKVKAVKWYKNICEMSPPTLYCACWKGANQSPQDCVPDSCFRMLSRPWKTSAAHHPELSSAHHRSHLEYTKQIICILTFLFIEDSRMLKKKSFH